LLFLLSFPKGICFFAAPTAVILSEAPQARSRRIPAFAFVFALASLVVIPEGDLLLGRPTAVILSKDPTPPAAS
jgi:hypothetical protein